MAAGCNPQSVLGTDGIKLSIDSFPQLSGEKTVGTEDSGKTSWSSSDVLYVVLSTQADSLAYRYRVTNSGNGWTGLELYEDGSYTAVTSISPAGETSYRAEVYYAPSYEFAEGSKLALKDGLTPGTDEFLTWSSGTGYTLGQSASLNVKFGRNYARLRVSANAGYEVKLASSTFVPAGLHTSELGGYTLTSTADGNANAFFYGSWTQGTDISLMSYDAVGSIAAEIKYEGRDASVNGCGYAAYCIASEGGDDPEGWDGDDSTVDDNDADDFLTASDFTKVITVTYSGAEATVTPTSILPVSVSGAYVVLGDTTSSVAKVKISVSGSTTDGGLKVYNAKKMLLSLEGASITSKTGPAINNQCGKRTYVVLTGTNSLTDASTYTDTVEGEDAKGCFFSESQLIFSGDGSLTVKGNCKHAIASDDYVRVLGGTITVTGAASDGIKVNDYYRQDDGTVSITSTGDGIQCDDAQVRIVGGKLTANTTGEKASGIQATGDVIISGGEVNSTVSGNGSKCLKSDANVTISGGNVTLKTTGSAFYDSEDLDVSSPACIRAEGRCTLSGGVVSCTSTGKAGKGINAYDFICNDGADLTVSTSGSSYYYNRDYSYAKGIKGSHSVVINGGKVNVTTTGSGAEGIESKDSLTVNGGEVYIKAYDDAINAAGPIAFNGGYTYAYSTGNDAIDSNYGRTGSVVFGGGVVIAHASKSPEEGIDADNDAYLTFSGGTVFCTGGKQGGGGGPMGGSSSGPVCSQSTILLSNTSVSTGYFTVTDSAGNVLFSFHVPRAMSQNYSFLSSPMLKSGTTYKYGVTSSKPSGATGNWSTWYYAGGTASVSSGTFSATGSYQSVGGTGGGRRPW